MSAKPSRVVDTRVTYCGDNLDHLRKLREACIDLICIDPPFNSNRNYEAFRERKDRHRLSKAHQARLSRRS